MVLCLRAGADSALLTVAEQAVARVGHGDPTPLNEWATMYAQGTVAVLRDDQAAAAAAYQDLTSRSGGLVVMPWGCVSGHRVAGNLCATLANREAAAHHFQASETLCGEAGYLLELAWTRYDHARFLQATDRGSVRALSLLDAALQDARQIGLASLESLCRRALGPVIPDGAPPTPLSSRERKVLALIADGSTNQEIAATLSISANTVEKHVGSILRKTGTHSRTEAAVSASRSGMV